MAERRPSTVASYLSGMTRPAEAAWKGGKGRRGPLGNWLLRERAAIVEGKTPGAGLVLLTWKEVAELAFRDGVGRKSGGPYRDYDVRKKWSDLADAGLVPRLLGEGLAVNPQEQGKPLGAVPTPTPALRSNTPADQGGRGGAAAGGTASAGAPATTGPDTQQSQQEEEEDPMAKYLRKPKDAPPNPLR